MSSIKPVIKDLLGEIPWSTELYWKFHKLSSLGHFGFRRLPHGVAKVVAQAMPHAQRAGRGKKVFLFASLHYWIEEVLITGLALAGHGHQVTIGCLPYADWYRAVNRFDLRRCDMYTRDLFAPARPLLSYFSLISSPGKRSVPPELQAAIERITTYDVQYTQQVEDIDPDSEIYHLRAKRNDTAARVLLRCFERNRPDVVAVPNGLITEFGVTYETARYLDIPVTAFEFGDQADRFWVAQNVPIARHITDDLWNARKKHPLTAAQRDWLQELLQSRRNPTPTSSIEAARFARLYRQFAEVRGGQQIRTQLGLDGRPVVLMPTNVLGDTLTLGRQVFTATMTEWVLGTISYFLDHREVQLVIRLHPGEVISLGPSLEKAIREAFGELPEHIHIVQPKAPVNTYDLLEIADLGLVYTTTTGLEIATRGIPILVGGQTHYRGRGFSMDPTSWDEYRAYLDQTLKSLPGLRLNPRQLELAWNYAYRFFGEYVRPFPWHLARLDEDLKLRPMDYILSEAGREQYSTSFGYLAGEPIDWKAI